MWKSTPRFHQAAWLLWLAAAMLAALSTRNPLYLAVLIGVAWLVGTALKRADRNAEAETGAAAYEQADPAQRGRGLLLRAVVGLTILVAILKGMSLHVGVNVLFTLPEEWPVIGGPITVEAMVS